MKNQMTNGKWLILLEDMTLIGKTIYKELEGYESNAVIATALETIKMPDKDFVLLAHSLVEKYPDAITFDVDTDAISSVKPCSTFSLGNLTLRIAGLYHRIPQIFYTEATAEGGCRFLFERNDEYSADKDSIVSDDGVADAASNNGYILGLPFVRAFMVYFDFEKNTVGLASKLNNYGAIITS